MPKIQPEVKIAIVPLTVKLREDYIAKIRAYCSYLNDADPSSEGYVITESFKVMITGDKPFEDFWAKNSAKFLKPVESAKRGRPSAKQASA